MTDIVQIIIDSAVFVLPLWFGNASPTVLGGGRPIDGGRYWRDGNRLLGDGKTIRGFWAGVLVSTIIGGLFGLLSFIFPIRLIPENNITLRIEYLSLVQDGFLFGVLRSLRMNQILENPISTGLIIGFVITFGGLTGDILGSFIKRRSGIERGKTFIFLDQLGFLVIGFIFIYPIVPWPIEWFLILVPTTFVVHIVANLIGFFTGIQDNPL
ncbi:MAG: CDP-archaeol synthase [Candidatus Heimdallarchaeota archaeon]|nr:CDP-archaeol synthase [Candidatus Heimdallarchaeota archaeon]